MNILILNWRDPKNPKAGGAEFVTMEHAKAWVKAGHTVTWFTSLFPKAKKEETTDGVKVIRRGSSLSVYLLAPFFYLFSKSKFDVVIDEVHGVPFFTPLFVRKPKIAFIHEVAGVIWDYMYPFPINKVGRFLENRYFSLYRKVPFWTDAPSTINELARHGISRKQCAAIPCPITNEVIQKLPMKAKAPTYIFVSRLVKMKGIEDVLKAFAVILHEQKDAELWLVGGGEAKYVAILHRLSKKLEIDTKTKFWGRVSEERKLDLLGKAHILLHASVKEGWGLVVLEAASQGTPSIVYKVPGLVDSVKDGESGIIVKENTPEMLAKEAIALFQDKGKYRRLQQGGFSWVKSITWSTVTNQSLKMLHA